MPPALQQWPVTLISVLVHYQPRCCFIPESLTLTTHRRRLKDQQPTPLFLLLLKSATRNRRGPLADRTDRRQVALSVWVADLRVRVWVYD